ncbi:ABC transporter ATP-binding protein [Aquipuribacter nitratireducens]|uniref:ABC transporter ATP-binding protein n=1 Tax=Aquipuribacter nitratireducens TaxID=650104 RepID=A0ABW0GJI9_9MICO
MSERTSRRTGGSPPTVVVDDLRVTFEVQVGRHGGDGRRRRGTTRQRVEALKGISAVVHRGEAVGIVGRNGSGKSTFLRAIAGLSPVSGGAVWASATPTLLGVNAALLPNLSGERNIELGCLAIGMTPKEIRERKDEIAEFSGIGDAIYRPMRTYSAGMGSRLKFAIATAKVPEVLLIDEALNTGDAEFRERSQERIRQLQAEAGTVFLVSHTLAAVEDTCTRTMWIHDGELRLDGPTEEVLGAYKDYNAGWRHFRAGTRREAPRLPGPVVGLDRSFSAVVERS